MTAWRISIAWWTVYETSARACRWPNKRTATHPLHVHRRHGMARQAMELSSIARHSTSLALGLRGLAEENYASHITSPYPFNSGLYGIKDHDFVHRSTFLSVVHVTARST